MTQRLVQKVNSCTFTGLVTPLPGCPDVAVSHAVFNMNPDLPGSGSIAMNYRLGQLKDMGYSGVLCTVERSNEKQIHILRTTNWNLIHCFHNKRTNHNLDVWFKQL